MEEIWKGVIYQGVDYSWRLEVSSLGRIRNSVTKKVYKQFLCKTGYYQICTSLGDKNSKKIFRIHRCVAESFIENVYDYKIVVNHKDLDKTNNNINNLEFCTYKENSQHAILNGVWGSKKGRISYNSKISTEQLKYILFNYIPRDFNFGTRGLSRMFNVNHSVISKIICYKIYKKEIEDIIYNNKENISKFINV